ncbi:MAG: TolC family protein [Verrucomicrobia bacterium]|nr:TolC family protein [Verrucomicrobiota bacterium]
MNISFTLAAFRPLGGLFLLNLAQAQEAAPNESATVSLTAIVEGVVAQNPELKFYEAEIAAAKAGVRASTALNNPELSLDLGRRRVRDVSGVLAGEGASWGVAVTQTFEWPGRLALRKAVANRQVELAELGLARFKVSLESRARVLAFGLYASAEKGEAAREVADRFAALKETFLTRSPAGVTPLLETRVIEATELALQRRATESTLAMQSALVELNQLRGVAPAAPLKASASSLRFHPAPPLEALISAARENNFDFRAKKVELEQQGFALQLAQNERYPTFSVSPSYSQAKAGDRETNYGLGLSIPLPLSARSRAGIDVAKARRRQAEVAVVVAQRDLEREVIGAAQAFSAKVGESQRWSPESVQKFREAAELADRHYRLGAVPVATYVELQKAYLEAVEALLDTKREALESGLRLQQLTGLDFKPVEIVP